MIHTKFSVFDRFWVPWPFKYRHFTTNWTEISWQLKKITYIYGCQLAHFSPTTIQYIIIGNLIRINLFLIFRFIIRLTKHLSSKIFVKSTKFIINEITTSHAIQKHLRKFCTVFTIILTSNLLGRLPFNFTWTSSLITNLILSTFSLISCYAICYRRFGNNIINPVLFKNIEITIVKNRRAVLELISINIRFFSLAIRLFSNRLAGHILRHRLGRLTRAIVINLGRQPLTGLSILRLIAPIIAFVFILERCVALLQTYVFILLTAIYSHETENI